MGKRAPARLAAATTAVALALTCLASCRAPAPSAGPGGTEPVPSTTGAASPVATAAAIVPAPEAEEAVRKRALAMGMVPAGPLTAVHRHGRTTWFLFPTTEGALCEGEYVDGVPAGSVGCRFTKDLTTGPGPGLQRVFGPGTKTQDEWLMVFYANHEEVRSLSCSDARLTVTRIGSYDVAGEPRDFYTAAASWLSSGTVRAEVVGPDGPTDEKMDLGTVAEGSRGDFTRECFFLSPSRRVSAQAGSRLPESMP